MSNVVYPDFTQATAREIRRQLKEHGILKCILNVKNSRLSPKEQEEMLIYFRHHHRRMIAENSAAK